jgi:hypothetical protein
MIALLWFSFVISSQSYLVPHTSKHEKSAYTTAFLSNDMKEHFVSNALVKLRKFFISAVIAPSFLFTFQHPTFADDELAKFAAEGNKVGVDGQCFFKKCALETSACANDPNCLKGLSCLARCKGASMCSTGCFAKFGSERLDSILSCSVEKNDCVHVPGKETVGWKVDKLEDLPSHPVSNFDINDMKGKWFKVMGLDSRYDCFDCQKNTFKVKNQNTLSMEAMFRIPRPTAPGYLQSRIAEELTVTSPNNAQQLSQLQSKGEMFGLTFWENWYVLGELQGTEKVPDLRLIYYTGHTLQGSYKGAFVYSRTKEMSSPLIKAATGMIQSAGLNPNDFCIIHNQCFDNENKNNNNAVLSVDVDNPKSLQAIDKTISTKSLNLVQTDSLKESLPFWYLGQQFFQITKQVAAELADWFEDPTLLSDWLISQQEKMVFNQPLVSPFLHIFLQYTLSLIHHRW